MHGTDIGVDHAQLLVEVGFEKLAEQPEARVVDYDFEIIAAHRAVQQAALLLIAHVRRNHMADGRQFGGKLAQSVLAAGAQDQLIATRGEQLRHFASQTRGRAGNQCFHALSSISL